MTGDHLEQVYVDAYQSGILKEPVSASDAIVQGVINARIEERDGQKVLVETFAAPHLDTSDPNEQPGPDEGEGGFDAAGEGPLLGSPWAELLRERGKTRVESLWAALMRCNDCDHRIIDHDEVAARCLVCLCDQGHRGLSAYADERLVDFGRVLRMAEAARDSVAPREAGEP
jgi:hypothetical protein